MYPSGVSVERTRSKNIGLLHLLRNGAGALQSINARYYMHEIDDGPINPSPTIDLAKACVCGLYLVPDGVAVGLRDALRDPSQETVTAGGGSWFDVRPKQRVREFESPLLDEVDAYGTPFEMEWDAGVSGQFVTIFDVSDTEHWKRTWLCRAEEVSGVEWPYGMYLRKKWRLKEVL
jgi:hypothetical protein